MSDSRGAPSSPSTVASLLDRPDALRTVYQPVIDLRAGELAGYEALTRVADWPARSPRPWFDRAAEEGLGGVFEAAALRQALVPRGELPPGLFLSLNVDPGVLGDPAVTGVLLDEPDLHGLLLELCPVTGAAAPEAAVLDTAAPDAGAGPALEALRARGALVAVTVSDAGVPDQQLVTAVRPDVVQLDPDLVRGVEADLVRERLVRLSVDVATDVGAVTLACGVEDLPQARHLQRLGVTLGQGWLFGRARPGLLPPSDEACHDVRAAGRELAELTTVRGLVVPVPVDPADPVDPLDLAGGWRTQVDAAGRLRGLIDPDGRTRPVQELVRLRPGQDVVAAAHRVLGDSGPLVRREWADAVPVVDERGSVLGIVSVARLTVAALAAHDVARVACH